MSADARRALHLARVQAALALAALERVRTLSAKTLATPQ